LEPRPPLTRAREAHIAAESHGSASCQQLAERMADSVAELLMGLIVADDQRHHSLLQLMVRRLHEEVEFSPAPTALPLPPDSTAASTLECDPELAASLHRLIRDEHEGARYLRHLGRQEPTLYGDCTSCCWKPSLATPKSTRSSCASCCVASREGRNETG
jgi:hypothetical protein